MSYATPVRVHWDVGAVDEGVFRVLDDLAASRPFFATLAFTRGVDGRLLAEAGARLGALGTKLAVQCRASDLEELPRVKGYAALHVDFTDAALPAASALAALAGWAPVVGLRTELWTRHVPLVGPALDLCRAAGVPRLVLANPTLVDTDRGREDGLRHAALERLEGDLEARREWLDQVEAVIHDLFVWRLFARYASRPPTRGEYAGCQAANALAYIGPDATLYGCQTLRKPLGSLLESPLATLWDSPGRRAIRRMLEAHPEQCRTCGHYADCRAGCRGMAEFVHDDFDEADPGCPFYQPAAAPP